MPRCSSSVAVLVSGLVVLPVTVSAQDQSRRSEHAASRSSSDEQRVPVRFAADGGTVEVVWQRGEDALVRASATVRQPKMTVIGGQGGKDPQQEPLPGSGQAVRKAAPLPVEVDRLSIHDARVAFVDAAAPTRELLSLYELQIEVENFSTRRIASGGLPTMITARGRIGRDGQVALFATINPWSGELDFAGRAQVTNLRVEELATLIEQSADVRPTGGKLSIFIEFSVHDGVITGQVKPFISSLSIAPSDSTFTDHLKTWFARGAYEVLSVEVDGRERAATSFPLRGTIRQPEPAVWDALVGVLENAFIEAVGVGYGQ